MGGPGGRWSIARAAVLVTGLTAASTVLGFLRDVVVAAVFGASAELDAWLVAQGVLNVVLGLLAWAMARSVTPVTSRKAARSVRPTLSRASATTSGPGCATAAGMCWRYAETAAIQSSPAPKTTS
ncbi:hypothetical protein [Kocuria rhizosphaericola]|uniref:hypothetical protein n=1 Tax=Kocuria rhizosphaericola TaxID=3376284 RepID=UPI0037AA18BA